MAIMELLEHNKNLIFFVVVGLILIFFILESVTDPTTRSLLPLIIIISFAALGFREDRKET